MNECIFFSLSGVDNNIAPTHNWPHHPQPLPLALLSQSESRMEAGLLTSLQHTSIQGFPGQQLSSSQLSFSSSVAPPSLPAPERFCHTSFLENSGHRAGQRAGLGQGGGLHYDSHIGKWSFSGRKGFNGPAVVEAEGGTVTIRTQVAVVGTFIEVLKQTFKSFCMSYLFQPTPSAPLQEVGVTQDPLGATQMVDPTPPTAGDHPSPREESTELPLLEHLR